MGKAVCAQALVKGKIRGSLRSGSTGSFLIAYWRFISISCSVISFQVRHRTKSGKHLHKCGHIRHGLLYFTEWHHVLKPNNTSLGRYKEVPVVGFPSFIFPLSLKPSCSFWVHYWWRIFNFSVDFPSCVAEWLTWKLSDTACYQLKPASDSRLIYSRFPAVALVPSNAVHWPSHCKLTLLFKLKEGRG